MTTARTPANSAHGKAQLEAIDFARMCGVCDEAITLVLGQPTPVRSRQNWIEAFTQTQRFVECGLNPDTHSWSATHDGIVEQGPRAGMSVLPLLQHHNNGFAWGHDAQRNQSIFAWTRGDLITGGFVAGKRIVTAAGFELAGRAWIAPDGSFTDRFVMKPLGGIAQPLFDAMQKIALGRLRGRHLSEMTPAWPKHHPDHVPEEDTTKCLIHEVFGGMGVAFRHDYRQTDSRGHFEVDLTGRHMWIS